MHFKLTKIDDDVVHGVVHGLPNENDAHKYLSTPAPMPCQENLCMVESWVAKGLGDVPGKRQGDWKVAFLVKNPVLLKGIRSGDQAISVGKNRSGLIEFNINNVKKCVKVNKNMSQVLKSAAEQIDELASGLVAKSGSLDHASARVLIRKQRPDLAEEEAQEYRFSQMARMGYLRKESTGEEDEIDEAAKKLMALNPTEFPTFSSARDEIIRRLRESGLNQGDESAADEIEKLAEGLVQKGASMDISLARHEIRKHFPDLARREAAEARASRFYR